MSTIEQRLARLEADLRQHYHLMPSPPDGNGLPVSLAMLPGDETICQESHDDDPTGDDWKELRKELDMGPLTTCRERVRAACAEIARLRAELAAMTERAEKAERGFKNLRDGSGVADEIQRWQKAEAERDAAMALLREAHDELDRWDDGKIGRRNFDLEARIAALLEKAK
jgi:uncharacterized small protein (DUF1192 family)